MSHICTIYSWRHIQIDDGSGTSELTNQRRLVMGKVGLEETGATVLQHWTVRKVMCVLSTEACRPILVATPDKVMKMNIICLLKCVKLVGLPFKSWCICGWCHLVLVELHLHYTSHFTFCLAQAWLVTCPGLLTADFQYSQIVSQHGCFPCSQVIHHSWIRIFISHICWAVLL